MDGLNNNTINSFDLNYVNTFAFGDDVRNHNESRTTARITPLTNPPYSSQECHRMNIDRMKDRQISVLIQKNNQLQLDIMSMRYRASNTLPIMHDYGILEPYGINNAHLQVKLLTTALDEKSEELKQAKEEHDLIMEERSVVHKELREQAAEIERLKRQLQGHNVGRDALVGTIRNPTMQSGYFDLAKNISEGWSNQLRDIGTENEVLKYEITQQKRIIQDLTNEKERTCQQLDSVINQFRRLKNSFNQKRSVAEYKLLQQFTDEKYEIRNENIKVTDLKMALLNIDNSGDSDSGDNFKQLDVNASHDGGRLEHKGSFHLRFDDKLLDIDGVDVTVWSEEQILDHLSQYGSGKYIKVVLSRPCGRYGTFHSWKAAMKISSAESFALSPLWLVTKGDLSSSKDQINVGDILQMSETCDGSDSVVSVLRLSPSPFTLTGDNVDHINSGNSCQSGNESTPTKVTKPDMFFPPVLPKKRRTSHTTSIHQHSLDRPMSATNAVPRDRFTSNKSNNSVVSAPPIPPRSSTSLQCSFIDNIEASCISNLDYSEPVFNDDSASDKLKMSVHSAFSRTGDIDGSMLSSEIMSESYSGSTDFVPTKMPKLGKCRNVVLNIPSEVFNLKQLGLHLLHSKSDQYPSSKSDVDVSVVNQIFIRHIEPNSCASQAGLALGDEIISINNQPVSRMTSEEAEHILMANLLKQHNLKKDQKKIPLIIKVQFQPLKMYELTKAPLSSSLDTNASFSRFTRSMYEDSRFGSFAQDKWNSHRLHVIRSSSNLNITESPNKSLNVVEHLLTKTRTVRINMCTVLSLIKIMGGSAMGIFISNIEYRDKESESIEKDSVGNRLALGDKIIDINGESYQRAIGEDAISSLNRFGHQVTLTVLYEPSSLLKINSDPLCQEHFYMEAMFSFSEIDDKLAAMSNKGDKCTSLSNRLDYFGLSIYFIKNYHLDFERGDLLLVDATILPASMTRRQQDNHLGCDWHAWVVDRYNTKIREGMIPSAFWLQKMITTSTKSSFYRSPLSDKNSRFSMRSTPSSPKSDINTFLSSNSTQVAAQSVHRHNRHSSLSQKLFRRFSIRNSFHSTATSVDETRRKISFSKEMAFQPLKRISKDVTHKRPVMLLGPHSETIAMVLASKWSQKFMLSTIKAALDIKENTEAHKIISPVSIGAVKELHQANVYPIVILLKFKSAKEIRQLKIEKSIQITVNKSESFRLHSQIKDLENNCSHLINGVVTPGSVGDCCQEIREMIDKIQMEDVWLRTDRYQYSA